MGRLLPRPTRGHFVLYLRRVKPAVGTLHQNDAKILFKLRHYRILRLLSCESILRRHLIATESQGGRTFAHCAVTINRRDVRSWQIMLI